MVVAAGNGVPGLVPAPKVLFTMGKPRLPVHSCAEDKSENKIAASKWDNTKTFRTRLSLMIC